MSASRTERLLNLLLALLNTRYGLQRSVLRDKVYHDTGESDAAFGRMFERDKAELRRHGFEIETLTDIGFGSDDPASTRYRIGKESNRLPDVTLTPAEWTVLSLAAQLWEYASLGSAAANAVRKLQASGGTADVELPAGVQPRIKPAGQAFDTILAAMHARQAVTFGYRAASTGVDEERKLEPWGIGNRFAQWYVVGWDRARGAKRFFRLSRMTTAVTIQKGDAYERPKDFDMRAELDSLPELPVREAVVKVEPGRLLGLRRRTTGSAPDGGSALLVPFRDIEAMAQELASYGPHATVISPQELRDAVVERLRGALAANSQPMAPAEFPDDRATAPKARKRTSEDQLARLLQLVPFLVHNQGLHIQEVADKFGVTRRELVADLQLLICSGLPGGYPDDLLDIQWEDDHVVISEHLDLNRPVRFSPEEASALLAGLATLRGLPGLTRLSGRADAESSERGDVARGDADDPTATNSTDALESVTLKLMAAAGEAGALAGSVAGPPVGPGESETFDVITRAIERGEQLHLRYFSAQRDSVSERNVDPLRIYSLDNTWYFEAYCHSKRGIRNFRLDRIEALQATGQAVSGLASVEGGVPAKLYTPSDDDSLVVLRLSRQGVGIADDYYADRTAALPDGGLLAEIRVGSADWLPMLVAQHGGAAAVVEPEELRSAAVRWIEAGLARYVGADAGPKSAEGA
ncbi:YafY family protein [Arthrobacter sp. M4]|uniref:helix-turn-helix transcriptional regulator n=1 Tax=Arthrobacter sp. M4 TaxID=218160 RepID=UPI001CDC4E42|nr:WYL domain-containing protein [Arthrobacter sp. M4]MCA4131460.1 WYL domain-containing protein [Arthrobacter sp. M4]